VIINRAKIFKRIWIVLLATIVFSWLGTLQVVAIDSLSGAGASFPETLYDKYFQEYQKETGTRVKYSAIGSGAGIRRFIADSVDFAASDAPPTELEKSQIKRGLQLVPTAGGAVAIIYNLKGSTTDVSISRDKLAKIFTGQISNWKQVNPRLPTQTINVVVRSDSSGTSYIFSNFLSEVTGGKIKASKKPNWGFKVFSKRPQNSGVAGEVKRIRGAITYVQASFAQKEGLPIARIQNRAGQYVKPTIAEANKALREVQFNDDFTVENIVDPKDGYPIVGVTWLLLHEQYPQAVAKEIKSLVTWILTKGQTLNQGLQYTRIPEDVAKRAIAAVNQNITAQ